MHEGSAARKRPTKAEAFLQRRLGAAIGRKAQSEPALLLHTGHHIVKPAQRSTHRTASEWEELARDHSAVECLNRLGHLFEVRLIDSPAGGKNRDRLVGKVPFRDLGTGFVRRSAFRFG